MNASLSDKCSEETVTDLIKMIVDCQGQVPVKKLADPIILDPLYLLNGCTMEEAIKENSDGWETGTESCQTYYTFDGGEARAELASDVNFKSRFTKKEGIDIYKITTKFASETNSNQSAFVIRRKYTEVKNFHSNECGTFVQYYKVAPPQTRKRSRNTRRKNRSKTQSNSVTSSSDEKSLSEDFSSADENLLSKQFDEMRVPQKDSRESDNSDDFDNIPVENIITPLDKIVIGEDIRNVEKIKKSFEEAMDTSKTISNSDTCEEPSKKPLLIHENDEDIIKAILETESEFSEAIGKSVDSYEYLGPVTKFSTAGTTFQVTPDYQSTVHSSWKKIRENKRSLIWSVPYLAKHPIYETHFIFMLALDKHCKQQFKMSSKLLPSHDIDMSDLILPFEFRVEIKIRLKPSDDFGDGFSDPVIGLFKCDEMEEYSTHILIPFDTSLDEELFPDFVIKIIE